jgi:hypothetical protein
LECVAFTDDKVLNATRAVSLSAAAAGKMKEAKPQAPAKRGTATVRDARGPFPTPSTSRRTGLERKAVRRASFRKGAGDAAAAHDAMRGNGSRAPLQLHLLYLNFLNCTHRCMQRTLQHWRVLQANNTTACKISAEAANHARLHDAALERALETLAVALLPLTIDDPVRR